MSNRAHIPAIIFFTLAAAMLTSGLTAAVPEATGILYSQPPDANGGFLQSSWWYPDESVNDEYRWDNFTLASSQAITKIQWIGGYDPHTYLGAGAVLDFKVAIYGSTAGGTQPDVTQPPLVEYQTGGNAGETPAGTLGGVQVYAYQFALPIAFQAQGGTTYWVYLAAAQAGNPDWGVAKGTGGDGVHFRNVHEGNIYQFWPGDFAFSLLGTTTASYGVQLSGDQSQSVEAGQMAVYTVTITNTGSVADTFDLSVAGNTWPASLSDTSVTLAPGLATTFTAAVEVPSAAAGGALDQAAITAVSRGDSSQIGTVFLTTTSSGFTTQIYLPVVLAGPAP